MIPYFNGTPGGISIEVGAGAYVMVCSGFYTFRENLPAHNGISH